MTNIQRRTGFFFYSLDIQMIKRERQRSSFQEAPSSSYMQVWCKGKGRKTRHKDPSNTVFNTSCKIKQTLPVLCSCLLTNPVNYSQLLFKDVSRFSYHTRQCSGTHLDFHSLFAILYSVPLAKYFCLACSSDDAYLGTYI